MGKYFWHHKGKVLDWHWKRGPNFDDVKEWRFYIGDILVGLCFNEGRGSWSAVSWHENHHICPVAGFKNRHYAALFLLKFLDTEEERVNGV